MSDMEFKPRKSSAIISGGLVLMLLVFIFVGMFWGDPSCRSARQSLFKKRAYSVQQPLTAPYQARSYADELSKFRERQAEAQRQYDAAVNRAILEQIERDVRAVRWEVEWKDANSR